MDNDNSIVACICEGSSEQAIIELLLENNKLIFDKSSLLDGKIIRTRSASNFERDYLGKQFQEKIKIYRILDSRKEHFPLSKAYRGKVEVVNIITSPEIEMLIIHNEGKYTQYKKSGKKPSDFCKHNLKLKYVKSYTFVYDYFSDINVLMGSITTYIQTANIKKGEKTLCDIIRSTY